MKAINLFNEAFFWDCVKEEINTKEDENFIIERVLSQSLNRDVDFIRLKEFFSIDKIVNVALNSSQIFGNERIEDIAIYFNIHPNEIQNYIK